jgi:hypothetical protein
MAMEATAVDEDSYEIYYFNSSKSHILAFSLKSIIKNEKKYFTKYFTKQNNFLRQNEMGFAYRRTKVEVKEKALEDAKRHSAYWEDSTGLSENLNLLSNIIGENKDKKVVLYLSPLHPLYRSGINASTWKRYFDIIGKLASKPNVILINFINAYDNDLEMFQDGDHLLPAGADSLSAKFNLALVDGLNRNQRIYAKGGKEQFEDSK